jgi:predicted DCC family thiol-disulfide oxidoreductase YuxK
MYSWIKSLFDADNRVSLKTIFSIDLRSLALMRVLLSLLILIDLALRARDISVFYTDAGLVPRKTWLEINHKFHLSLHAASGDLWWQVLLFCFAAVFAVGLLVGYRTKLMTVLSWVLLASLLNRNEVILQGGDLLLVIMCFWTMFLPLGAKWSVDAALQPELKNNPNHIRFEPSKPQLYFSVATIAVILQVLYLYFFTALLKTGDAWRFPFEAAHYTLNIQHFATPIAMWFKTLGPLLPLGAAYVIAVEFIAPIMVLLPFGWPWIRIVGLLLLTSLHVAFMLLLHIGLFPFIDYMSLTVLIPSIVWIWFARKRANSKSANVTLYYDEDCGFCLKMCLILRELLLPDGVKILRAQSYTAIYEIMERENSWVITDGTGRHYIHWSAMAFLFRQSFLLKPIGWLMMFPPFMWIGNRIYHWVAENRGTMGTITATTLPFRSIKLKPTMAGQLVAAFFLYVVTVFNISTLPDMRKIRPDHVDFSSRITRIDQKWSMFAPIPLKFSMFPQVEGTLRNGEKINLHPLTDPDPDWEAPDYMYPLYQNYRWRKYFDRLRSYRNNAARNAFGHYQCKTWNTPDRPRNEQLGILTLHYVRLHTNTDGSPKKRDRKMSWQHWCYPEFKPKR